MTHVGKFSIPTLNNHSPLITTTPLMSNAYYLGTPKCIFTTELKLGPSHMNMPGSSAPRNMLKDTMGSSSWHLLLLMSYVPPVNNSLNQ